MNLDDDVNFEELSQCCVDLSGADIKSIVCDAFLKAFHRTKSTLFLENNKDSDNLRNSIKICNLDFVLSYESIKQTINKNERFKLKKMYENWTNKKGDSISNLKQQNSRVTLA